MTVKWADIESDENEASHNSPSHKRSKSNSAGQGAGDDRGDTRQLSSLSDGWSGARGESKCQLMSESLPTFLVPSSDAQVGAVEPKVSREGEWQTDAGRLTQTDGEADADSQNSREPLATRHLAQGVIAAKIVVTQAGASRAQAHTRANARAW